MLSCTLREYKQNYNSRFLTYKKEYEDNTLKTFFLKEFEDYKAYHQALVDLKELILQDYEDVSIPVEVFTHEVSDLKRINENAYSQFITDEDNTRYLHLIDGKWKDIGPEDSSLIEFDKLENFIKSSNRILDFISAELDKSKRTDNLDFKAPDSDFISQDGNDFIKNTIIEYLEGIADDFINPADFNILVNALLHYFSNGKFPKLDKTINFKAINKKKVGWALKEVYKNLKREDLDPEYFRFAQENINLFSNEVIEEINFNQSNFYKFFTTNPAN